MKLKKAICLLILSIPIMISLKAQIKEGYRAEIEVQAIGTTNGTVPFWMRSNQFGSIPLNGVSGSVIGRLSKEYDEPSTSDQLYGRKKLFDWGFGIEGRANGGKNSNLQLIEGYVKGKAGIFQLKVGRTKDVMGLNGDTSLSSGNFAISGNALGVPKVDFSISEYFTLPIFYNILAIKGNIAHGWLGRMKILDSIQYTKGEPAVLLNNNTPVTYFHQKSLYGRIGLPDWRFKVYGGFSHQVTWGNEKSAYGSNFNLTPFNTFLYVLTGKAYGADGVPSSKIGNQIGSIDLGLEYNFLPFKLLIYRQNFYDVGALAKLANIADGLQGVSLSNNNYNKSDKNFQWKKVVLEYFNTKDQAGYPWSTPTKSGDEDYYNNYFYRSGWSYYNQGLGNPLITTRKDARNGQAAYKNDYFINNRVTAIHAGITGSYDSWVFSTKLSYSWNYGTFATSIFGKSTGTVKQQNLDLQNIFQTVQQLSFYINADREISSGYKAGFTFGMDQGRLLDNSIGLQLKLVKSFN